MTTPPVRLAGIAAFVFAGYVELAAHPEHWLPIGLINGLGIVWLLVLPWFTREQ
jgi:hypothetical protein